jgi:hypothetical protein
MPGVVRRSRAFSSPHPLRGFSHGLHVASGSLLAASVAPSGVDEVQTVTISGGPTGGNFTLTFRGVTTANIAYNAAATAVEDALETSFGNGNMRVTGAAGGPYTVTFLNDLGNQDVELLSAAHTFTGGTAPAIGVSETTKGDVAGRLLVRRGTILTKVPGNTSKVRRYTAQASEAIIGVLGRDVELFTTGSESDTDVPIWDGPGYLFDIAGVLDYATYSSAFQTWCAANGNRAY